MKQRALGWGLCLLLPFVAMAQTSIYDLQKPFGFCTQASRTTDTPYAYDVADAETVPTELGRMRAPRCSRSRAGLRVSVG